MGFLDGLMGKGGKWHDCQKSLQGLAGTLSRMPSPQVKEDGLLSAWFIPEDKSVLTNRNNVRNKNDMLELRLKLASAKQGPYLEALKAMADKKAWVSGALVNDDAKEGKAELHPVDLVWARLPLDLAPEWVKGMTRNLKDPFTEIQYFRILAASSDTKSGPAPALETHKAKATFPYPAKPPIPNPELKYEIKPLFDLNADIQLNHERIRDRLELVVELKCVKENGPTVYGAELVVFWN